MDHHLYTKLHKQCAAQRSACRALDRPWALLRGDALQCMYLLPDDSVDLVVTDPAYESLNKWRDSKARIEKYESDKAAGKLKGKRIPRLREWFDVVPNSYFFEFFHELYRVLAPNSHAYIFCDDETSDVYRLAIEGTGFHWWRRVVWDKVYRGQGYNYALRHEFVVYLAKGKRKLNSLKHESVIQCPRVKKSDLGRQPYPTEKPVSLLRTLIENSSEEGQLVLDPFAGSGSTGAAALASRRQFLGFDTSLKAIRLMQERLSLTEAEEGAGT